jgi:hypothetical protein
MYTVCRLATRNSLLGLLLGLEFDETILFHRYARRFVFCLFGFVFLFVSFGTCFDFDESQLARCLDADIVGPSRHSCEEALCTNLLSSSYVETFSFLSSMCRCGSMCSIVSWRIERNAPSFTGRARVSLFASFSPSPPETKYVAIIFKSSIGVTSFSYCKKTWWFYVCCVVRLRFCRQLHTLLDTTSLAPCIHKKSCFVLLWYIYSRVFFCVYLVLFVVVVQNYFTVKRTGYAWILCAGSISTICVGPVAATVILCLARNGAHSS